MTLLPVLRLVEVVAFPRFMIQGKDNVSGGIVAGQPPTAPKTIAHSDQNSCRREGGKLTSKNRQSERILE